MCQRRNLFFILMLLQLNMMDVSNIFIFRIVWPAYYYELDI